MDKRLSIPFPNLWQWTFGAVDRIVIGNWQGCDVLIGVGPFARPAAKQVPVASVRVRADDAEILTAADIPVRHAGWNYNHIAGMNLDVLSVLAADPQGCTAAIDSQRFMRRAVIMSQGINAVSP